MAQKRENPARERRASKKTLQCECNAHSDFLQAMEAEGLATKDPIIADGRLRRFRVIGEKANTRNGWYVLHSDGVPAGVFGHWKTGIKYRWCAKSCTAMSPEQYAEHKQRREVAHKVRAEEEHARCAAAGKRAADLWAKAAPATNAHPYLLKKGVRAHGLRLSRSALVVPMRDSAGVLHSLQFIDGDGQKRFLTGGKKKGCYFAIGKPIDRLCIAEGYATAASIYEATGIATAVAFDAGNMAEVAKALRAKFPNITIVICADNDTQTRGNPGLSKATAAAQAVGGLLAVAGAEVSHA